MASFLWGRDRSSDVKKIIEETFFGDILSENRIKVVKSNDQNIVGGILSEEGIEVLTSSEQ